MTRFARSSLAKYGGPVLRNVVFRYDDSVALAAALGGVDQELVLPEGETVNDGEWVLAVFEIGLPTSQRGAANKATAAAGRGAHRGAGAAPVVAFERRDWERLVLFAEAGSMSIRAAAPIVPPDVPTQRSLVPEAPDSETTMKTAPEDRQPSVPDFGRWRRSDPFAQGPTARVMLVDDDPDIREVVGAMLDAVGLTVDAVMSAEEALVRVRGSAYDLLVLDWNLPGMTGIELCRLIRKDPHLSTLPVLFLTAHAASRDVVEAFASGADDYVVKPFRAPELGARIFGLLRRARMAPPAF